MGLLRALFIWWRDATLGTKVTTWLTGVPVGKDVFGNRYFRSNDGVRRWVIYNGTVDASRVPAEWHGWLHRLCDDPPDDGGSAVGHVPNLSGTAGAYYPPGSLRSGVSPAAHGNYEPWSPS
jgi:NADH:ubiquinone oxidoreductase subunit